MAVKYKLEDSQMRQLNETSNAFSKILAILFKKYHNKQLKKMMQQDPELKSAVYSLKYHVEELDRTTKNWCKHWPDMPQCKKYKKK